MAVKIPFVHEIDIEYGRVDQVSPLIRRVTANNPGGFTFKGTGTYIVGQGNVAVIDPGPLNEAHIAALLKAVEGETVTHVLITHCHSDHSPAAAPFKAATGAKTYAYGPHGSGKPQDNVEVEAGADRDFVPDIEIRHGDVIEGDGWTVECVFTPGHTSNHMCFALREEKALFSGDHVMGWSTTVVSPPDGDMATYMASLELLLTRDDEIYWPTHGPAITEPKPFVQAYMDHRDDRERQIIEQISDGRATIPEMVPVMYAAVDPRLHAPAARSVLAHLVRMVGDGRVTCDGGPDLKTTYRLA
ncbi:MAG: MBL fold metallo-hydrolase [Alphaproteobacteria bacterium]|nr:MBL fold metallo-hydrolase [Kordiimonadaceae bacterium]MBO6629872.1 MBL fold metallo-hydrolase [Alphaproteobacteria bacterium]